MKTYETIDGKFVNEDPGAENTIFGRNFEGKPIVVGVVLYRFNETYDYDCAEEVTKDSSSYIGSAYYKTFQVLTQEEFKNKLQNNHKSILGSWKNKNKYNRL